MACVCQESGERKKASHMAIFRTDERSRAGEEAANQMLTAGKEGKGGKKQRGFEAPGPRFSGPHRGIISFPPENIRTGWSRISAPPNLTGINA